MQPDRVVDADDRRRDAIKHEAPLQNRERCKRAAADVDQGAGHESDPAADPRHPQRCRHRRDRRAENIGRDAQRGKRLGSGQVVAERGGLPDGVGTRGLLTARVVAVPGGTAGGVGAGGVVAGRVVAVPGDMAERVGAGQ